MFTLSIKDPRSNAKHLIGVFADHQMAAQIRELNTAKESVHRELGSCPVLEIEDVPHYAKAIPSESLKELLRGAAALSQTPEESIGTAEDENSVGLIFQVGV